MMVNIHEAMGIGLVGRNGLLSLFPSMAEDGEGFLSSSSLTYFLSRSICSP